MAFKKENWLHSTATFHGGTSYSVGGMRFVRGALKRVTSIGVRRAIEGVKGFLIQDFYKQEPVPKKVVIQDPPEDPAGEPEGETDSPPKKKTVKKKKKVKKVKGGKNA